MNLGNRNNQHSFAKIPQVNMARSKFDRSFAVKDTMDFDYLVPILVDEVLPGDTINLNVKSFCRLATQVVPLMDNMYIDYYSFFVPNRLVWTNWERFMGAQDDPGDSIDFTVPTITSAAYAVGSIQDKMGIPTGVAPGVYSLPMALPFRGYQLIWNEWFRDQNLQNSIVVAKGDGPDTYSNYTLLKPAKKHDYFTSCLPNPQKGTDPVLMPVTGVIPVTTDYASSSDFQNWENSTGGGTDGYLVSLTAGSNVTWGGALNNSLVMRLKEGDDTFLIADAANSTAGFGTTINELRQAMMLQSLLELDARGGTRYIEIIRAHFNVTSPDARLQRPEFLSGGTTRIVQHVVAQTSESGTTDLGTLAAYSTAANMGGSIGFSKSFVEHGWIFVLVRARADITYQQGLNRKWSRQTRYDYFWPKLQELGEQAVGYREIYMQGTVDDLGVFGYQERYAEYRYHPSEIRGQFRSTFAQSLDVWHLAEEFSAKPELNATFIQSSTPIERSLVVDAAYPHLLCDYWFDYKAARPMMTYGVPATLGRF